MVGKRCSIIMILLVSSYRHDMGEQKLFISGPLELKPSTSENAPDRSYFVFYHLINITHNGN